MSCLSELLEMYRGKSYICPEDETKSFLCSCFLLGSLSKGMQSAGTFDPRPEVPFQGISFDSVCSALRGIEQVPWYAERSRYSDPHSCNINEIVKATLKTARDGTTGLSLHDFKRVYV
jgi:hypothetical protein